jgi:hypothetical protein
MVTRQLFLPLAVLVIAIAGCGGVNDSGEPGGGNTDTQSAAARQISGNWRGTLHQAKLPPFQIAVDISAGNTAQVAYTGIKCGGEWSLDQVQAPSPSHFIYVFTEQINQGAGGSCKGTGRVSVSPIQREIPNEPAYQQMRYRFSGGGVTSRGLIHRTDPEHIHAIFKQAGVPTPPS